MPITTGWLKAGTNCEELAGLSALNVEDDGLHDELTDGSFAESRGIEFPVTHGSEGGLVEDRIAGAFDDFDLARSAGGEHLDP